MSTLSTSPPSPLSTACFSIETSRQGQGQGQGWNFENLELGNFRMWLNHGMRELGLGSGGLGTDFSSTLPSP